MTQALSNPYAAAHRHGRTIGAQAPGRAFIPLYHSDTINHCPGCGGTHWHVGRMSAECACSATKFFGVSDKRFWSTKSPYGPVIINSRAGVTFPLAR
mgnify:CR=1 FL=1